MGIIREGLKKAAKETLLVALIYGGKKVVEKIAGSVAKAASKKKNGDIDR